MRLTWGHPIKSSSLLESHWHAFLTAQVHDFLYARTACAFRNQYSFDRSARLECLPYGVNANQNSHICMLSSVGSNPCCGGRAHR